MVPVRLLFERRLRRRGPERAGWSSRGWSHSPGAGSRGLHGWVALHTCTEAAPATRAGSSHCLCRRCAVQRQPVLTLPPAAASSSLQGPSCLAACPCCIAGQQDAAWRAGLDAFQPCTRWHAAQLRTRHSMHAAPSACLQRHGMSTPPAGSRPPVAPPPPARLTADLSRFAAAAGWASTPPGPTPAGMRRRLCAVSQHNNPPQAVLGRNSRWAC